MSRVPHVRVRVHIDLDEGTVLVGTAYVSERRGVVSTVFEYEASYLERSGAHAVSPDLPLMVTTHHVSGLPGAMADSAPDRWGRTLIRKRALAEARRGGQARPTLHEVDYLLGVGDATRQGALRFSLGEDEPFLAQDASGVPPITELPRLLRAADAVSGRASDGDDWSAVKALLAAGTGTLGGARPKATVRSDRGLLIAKFPHHGDEWDVMAWEKTALDLAEACGITTPGRELVEVDGRHVLLLERFDRGPGAEGRRIGYASGMSLIGGHDGGDHDYLDLSEAVSEVGGRVRADTLELWRRIALSVMINNVDDHMRNHGFLWRRGGWCLSPAFDINPDPDVEAARATSVAGAVQAEECHEALLEVADDFGMTRDGAEVELARIVAGTANWRQVARANGVPRAEVADFAGALDWFR